MTKEQAIENSLIDGTIGSYETTEDIFQKQLHAYTITNAIYE